MKKLFVILLASVLFFIGNDTLRANPPTSVDVMYDHDAEVLTMKFSHQTRDRDDHYIRKIEYSINDGEVQKVYFSRQKFTLAVEKNLNIALEPFDMVSFKIFCYEGGIFKDTFIVPEMEGVDKGQP